MKATIQMVENSSPLNIEHILYIYVCMCTHINTHTDKETGKCQLLVVPGWKVYGILQLLWTFGITSSEKFKNKLEMIK